MRTIGIITDIEYVGHDKIKNIDIAIFDSKTGKIKSLTVTEYDKTVATSEGKMVPTFYEPYGMIEYVEGTNKIKTLLGLTPEEKDTLIKLLPQYFNSLDEREQELAILLFETVIGQFFDSPVPTISGQSRH